MIQIPSGAIEGLLIEYGRLSPLSKNAAFDILQRPDFWLPEASTTQALISAFATIEISKESVHGMAKMLTERGAPNAAIRLQKGQVAFMKSVDQAYREFMIVLKNRVADEDLILIDWPPDQSWYPPADGANSTMWAAAVASHRARWSHASWSWRCGMKTWLDGPLEEFKEITSVPAQVMAAQSSAETARSGIMPDRATSAEMAEAMPKMRRAESLLADALAMRRRNSLRSADASSMASDRMRK